jgi:putative two-component system response regulator
VRGEPVMRCAMPPTLLIVDDNAENLTLLGDLLHETYRVRAATSGERALQLAQLEPVPDLILLDIMMPGMNGYEVLARLHEIPATREIPVIFVTAMDADADEEAGLALGAVDYIAKPLRPAIVQARVRTHVELHAARQRLRHDNLELEAEVDRRLREKQVVQDVTIRALARLAETRDNETGHHILRTQEYVRSLSRRAAAHPRFAGQLDDARIALFAKSAPLHDIGKVGIPDEVLLKPGKLDAREWDVMKRHAAIGAQAIARAEDDAHEAVPFLQVAKQIARHHHERWDGTGYPDGLAGDAIPLPARVMALADVFDALISVRVYKPALPMEQARTIMAGLRGTHFDPDLLDLFIEGFDEFCAIARRHADDESQAAVHAVAAGA